MQLPNPYEVVSSTTPFTGRKIRGKSQHELFLMWQKLMFGKIITNEMELDEYGPSGVGKVDEARTTYIVKEAK